MSAIARAMRPSPRYASPARSTGSIFLSPSNQSRNDLSSQSARCACGGLVMDAFFEMQNPPGRRLGALKRLKVNQGSLLELHAGGEPR
jgi:hypothetical protein